MQSPMQREATGGGTSYQLSLGRKSSPLLGRRLAKGGTPDEAQMQSSSQVNPAAHDVKCSEALLHVDLNYCAGILATVTPSF